MNAKRMVIQKFNWLVNLNAINNAHLVFVVLHEVEGQAPHERQVPLARVDILPAAVRGGGGRGRGPSLLLDEEEGPEVVRGHGEEGDEILGLDNFTLRNQTHSFWCRF